MDPPRPQRVPVDSELLRSVGYDPAASTLEIELADGKVYEYFDVPFSVYDELMEAGSKGAYFNAFIKGIYSGQRIV